MAFLPSWACVIVGCFFASLAEASNFSDLYPPLWEESPGQFADYSVENGKYIINPWNYLERMGIYKILLNQTAGYFAKLAPENELNVLWGLPLQYGWQYSSGRLADPSQKTNCGYKPGGDLCVSVDSWWADMNYFLSALPFLAAVDSGIMGISSDQVVLLPPPKDQMEFCYDVSTCHSSFPETMSKWNAFYQYLQSPFCNFDNILKYLWAAHTSSLEDAVKKFEDRYEYYSKPEADFERSWYTTVEYLAALLFPTTLFIVHDFQKVLPPRILAATDVAPYISNFTDLQNTVLFGINILYDVNKYTDSAFLTAWKILMKTADTRALTLEVFEIILNMFN
ncbi:PREDICTED: UPF0762 protein C6orf58 homolog [Galeopterus variegatus]|uniref:UPF0762 protein C6orf58 homolog n=1 Tax=Galeopterus variegatus TaxID=482537 RepID=A0ABM0QV41_GALVR|nr:PREDICTED: UPF0762 protein C6orf58 homolog [Galeopterus variegatus]